MFRLTFPMYLSRLPGQAPCEGKRYKLKVIFICYQPENQLSIIKHSKRHTIQDN